MRFQPDVSPPCRKSTRAGRVAIFLGMAFGAVALLLLYSTAGGKSFESRDFPILLALVAGTIVIPGALLLTDNARRPR